MSDAATKSVRHYVAVYFRGHESAAWVPMESREAALAAVAFVAINYLRKHPQDRAGVWCPTRSEPQIVVNENGVADGRSVAILAAFDPREITGVQPVAREVEPWSDDA